MHSPSVLLHSEGRISSNVLFFCGPNLIYITGPLVQLLLQLFQKYVGKSDCSYFMWLGFLVVYCWVLPYRGSWERDSKSIPRHCTTVQRCVEQSLPQVEVAIFKRKKLNNMQW